MSEVQMLVYYSEATFDFSTENVLAEVGSIMRASRKNNPRDDLTGALFLDQSYFLQVLEGGREQVSAAYSRIAPDPRHKNPVIIGAGPIKARVFGKWSMGFFDSDVATSRIVEQYTGSPKFDPKLLTSAAAFNMMQALLNSRKAAA